MSPAEAIVIAQRMSRDLIEVVPNANPPVCKIMDFGKYKYELQKKEKLQKKHQHITLVKEIRFHPNTDVHDFEFKTKHALQFLSEGHKVKATVIFKGREITYKEHGEEILNRFAERLANVAKVDQPMHMEGRNMIVMYTPDRTAKVKPDGAEKKPDAAEKKTDTAVKKPVEKKTVNNQG